VRSYHDRPPELPEPQPAAA